MKSPLLIFAIILFVSFQNTNAQNSFSTATWLTNTGGYFYPQPGGIAQSGPDYGCMEFSKRPFWFIVSTCGTGTDVFEIMTFSYSPYDPNRKDSLDFVLWGPFDDTTNAFDQLTNDKIVICHAYWDYGGGVYMDDNFQAPSNKFYFGVFTSSDSINKLLIDASFFGVSEEYADSAHCTICNGKAAYMNQGICVVTVDSATGKNRIFWSPEDSSMAAYIIYRQSSVFGQYDSIGRVASNEPLNYIDDLSDPLVKSSSYLVGTEDSCGRIHWSYSPAPNTTMHLTTSVGLNGEVNLVWNAYGGLPEIYSTFFIFRSVNNEPFEQIDAIASNTTTYTDLNPPPSELHYKVGINPPSCYQGSEDFVYSNRSSVGTVGISEAALPEGVMVFPNPVHDKATLRLSSLAGKVNSIRLISVSGKNIMTIPKPYGPTVPIDILPFSSGIYILEIQTNESIYHCPIGVQ